MNIVDKTVHWQCLFGSLQDYPQKTVRAEMGETSIKHVGCSSKALKY